MADFDDFAADAAELFGLDAREAADLLTDLEEQGFDYETDTLREWGVEAVDLIDDYLDLDGDDDDSIYELDPTWPDDDWLDAGEWYEVTADYEED